MTLRPYDSDLQKQFRDTLKTPSAPEVIDDTQAVMPVAVVASTPSALNVSVTPPTKTMAWFSSSGGGAGSTTIGTVPANKKWTVTGVHVCASIKTLANGVIKIVLGGTDAVTAAGSGTATTNLFLESFLNAPYGTAPVLTAGQTIAVNNTSCDYWAYSILYTEESV